MFFAVFFIAATSVYANVNYRNESQRLAAGLDFNLVIKNDGTLWAWGRNNYGQLGDGTTVDRHTPIKVGSGFKAVAAGWGHSLGLKKDGTLWAWGMNHAGQLGDGTTNNSNKPI